MFTRGYSTAVHPPRGRCRQSCGEVSRRERTASDLCPLYLLWQSINSTLRCVRERHEPAHSPLYFSVCCSQFHTIICHRNPNFLLTTSLLFPSFPMFVFDPPGTHAHTHAHKRHSHAHHDNIFTSWSRRSFHFGLFTGALITLCLLAHVNTVTTWQRLNIWNIVIISPSSEKTQSVIPVAGCWLSAPTAAMSVSSAGQTWRGGKHHRKRNTADWRVTFGQQLSICLALSLRVCSF